MSEAAEKQRKALGKGLSALLPGRSSGQGSTATATAPAGPSGAAPSKLPIEAIQPNPMQPRVVFQPERLEELGASYGQTGSFNL
jgi:ParB family chromosome partitioning protein